MALHPKTLANVSHKINAIEAGTFDETHIEALLIQIREHVSSKSWTKDLGDFIAHPERDRGLFHDELNRRALALKLQLPGHAAYKIDLGNMSEDVFFMLETAVSRINNKHWLAKLGLNQKDIKRLLAEVYVFDKLTKSHVFKKSLTYAQVKRTELVVHEALTPIQFQYL